MIQFERSLHEEIAWQLAAAKPDCAVFPIPNGIFLPTHSDEEKAIVRRIIARMKADGQLKPGAPDLVVLWRDGSGVIELKRPEQRALLGSMPAGRPSPAQREVEAQCVELGIQHRYCHSWDEMRAALREWGRLQ